jgi:hypothetical protein
VDILEVAPCAGSTIGSSIILRTLLTLLLIELIIKHTDAQCARSTTVVLCTAFKVFLRDLERPTAPASASVPVHTVRVRVRARVRVRVSVD